MSLRPRNAQAGDAHHEQFVANYAAFFSRKTTLDDAEHGPRYRAQKRARHARQIMNGPSARGREYVFDSDVGASGEGVGRACPRCLPDYCVGSGQVPAGPLARYLIRQLRALTSNRIAYCGVAGSDVSITVVTFPSAPLIS